MKHLIRSLLAPAVCSLLITACSSDPGKSTNDDSAKKAVQAESLKNSSAQTPVAAPATYPPDSGDAKKFMVRIYHVLKNNDSLVWRSQFTEEIQTRFHTPADLYLNFNVWKEEYCRMVDTGCNGDPEKLEVKVNGDSIEFTAGTTSHKIRAKLVNGQWKLDEM